MKSLIINADDFGYSMIFNKTILEFLKKELISSTTVMVKRIKKEQKEQIQELIAISKNKNISIWLHLEIESKNNQKEIEEEIEKQLKTFKKIFSFNPSHIDIHKPLKNTSEQNIFNNFCEKYKFKGRNMWFQKWIIKTTNEHYINWTRNNISEIEEQINKIKNGENYEILLG